MLFALYKETLPTSLLPSRYRHIMDTDIIGGRYILNVWLGMGNENIFLQLTLYGHIKTAEQRTITQQYGDWYTGRWWVDCYVWYSKEGTGRPGAPPSPLLAVPNITVHPSTPSVPTSYSMWRYNCLWILNAVSTIGKTDALSVLIHVCCRFVNEMARSNPDFALY